MSNTSNLLIELGVEELPSAALDVIYDSLAAKAETAFLENRLSHGKIRVEATPRRVALFVENLAASQRSQALEMSGPSVEKSYDATGKPTKALEGFMRSKGVSLADLKIKETPRGKFVVVERKETGQPAVKVLPDIIANLLSTLPFAKLMRWEPLGFRFPRPVRWLVVLLDKKVVPCKFADLKSGSGSRGHRFLSLKPFKILEADWKAYQKKLKAQHVVLSLEARKDFIRKALAGKYGQKDIDEELLHTAAQLVEEPFILQGTFSKTYLDLPAEVLASCMKKNQKIFAVYDARGRLDGRFVAVLNGKRNGLARVRSDYENVLESRLRDARFFYNEDTKQPLEKKFDSLEQVAYLGKLGTMKDKATRLEKLSAGFTALAGRNDLKEGLKRVAHLSKVDLMTQLVYEFPDLQGVVGRDYAREAGEDEEVALAIGTQYLPKNLAEDHRKLAKKLNALGALFGILDRLDLLVGAFGTGVEPTGSQDPYALRRAGGSIVKIIRAFRLHISLKEAIDQCIEAYGQTLEMPKYKLSGKLCGFLMERTVFELQAKPGTREFEILQAVMRSSFDDLADVYDRFELLTKLQSSDPDSFIKAAKVVERTANILKGFKGEINDVNPELLKEPLERQLFRICEEQSGPIRESLVRRDYEKATKLFGKVFYQTIQDFFEQVMVNAEDTATRTNRHALMKRINCLYTEKLADLSVLSRLDQK